MGYGVVTPLAPKGSWGQVKHADNYLRGELEKQKEEGIKKTEQGLYDGVNCDRDNFTKNTMCYMKQFDKHPERKCYEYVQSFSPEDKANGLTPAKAHEMGLLLAHKEFGNYPVLVVTHVDTKHIHNQFLVGNVNVENGKCFKQSTQDLNRYREYTAQLCQERGFTHSIHEMPSDRAITPKQKKSEKLLESQLHKQGRLTDKEQIAYIVRNEIPQSEDFEDLRKRLLEKYQIETRVTKNTISFSHPDMKRPIRGDKLGEDLSKGAIEDAIKYYQSERYPEELYNTIKSIADHEQRKDEARATINERYRERESSGGSTFPGQRSEETGFDAERIGTGTHKPSEAVRSITERIQRASIEGRQYFKDHIRELIEKYQRSKSEHLHANRKVDEFKSGRAEAEQRINNLNTERSQIPDKVRGINEELIRHQHQGHGMSR